MRILNTPIIVDSFQHEPGVTTYLLSHLHTDHTSGLSPSWNNGIIYTTKITSFLLKEKFHINPDLVVELDYDDCIYIDLTKGTVTSSKSSPSCIKLSIIDANHCVGSCMFLLEGYFGNILITGDFRFDMKILRHPFLQSITIDHLFLDDTFADPEYEFPSRMEAGKQLLSLVETFPENYRICIATDSLGKEELLVAVAMKIKSLVVVSEERLHQINAIRRVVDLPDVFTSDLTQGRIYCVDKRSLNYNTIMKMREEGPTVGIMPSGWSKKSLSMVERGNPTRKVIWRIGYSLHSSYSELKLLVETLKPKMLHSASNHDDASLRKLFQKYCSTELPKQYVTPLVLQEAMNEKVNRQAAILTPKRKNTRKSPPSTQVLKLKKKRFQGAKIFHLIEEDSDLSTCSSNYEEKEYINIDEDKESSSTNKCLPNTSNVGNRLLQFGKDISVLIESDDDDEELADLLGRMIESTNEHSQEITSPSPILHPKDEEIGFVAATMNPLSTNSKENVNIAANRRTVHKESHQKFKMSTDTEIIPQKRKTTEWSTDRYSKKRLCIENDKNIIYISD